MKREMTKADREFGKALCDRLGLAHNDTLAEWSTESCGNGEVMVTMTVFKFIFEDEFNELRRVAERRAAQ